MKEQESDIETNEFIKRLPPHLKQFIKPQHYEDYSPIDQAVWRYVMRKNVQYLSSAAHNSYIDGLKQTGISIEEIPSIYGMNRILKDIGWAAVTVDGFIPPNAFMEFQAYKVLVIACDIRQLENIEYTPAPDIIHEAAGHAPIIANPDYSEYLRRLGEIGAKAILSDYDLELYEAVRKLSILKEARGVDENEIKKAESEIERLQIMKVEFSEMAKIRNLQWWTIEYGLIGDFDHPKIYGAGLLSSIGESKSCMQPEVKKIPYSIDAVNIGFDITKPQPQLFITPDFPHLMQVLEEYANTMSVRKGGYKGLQKLIHSGMIGTIELSTGLQISGKFSRMIQNEDNEIIFFKTEGPTALAYKDKELIGHGIKYHKDGFSSPLGKLKNISLAIEDMGPVDLKAYNFYDGKRLSLEFESGVKIEGLNVTGVRNVQGKLMLIQLSDCTVSYKDEILFKPEWGLFDMAVGKDIISAFAGAADAYSFPNIYNASSTLTIKPEKSQKTLTLESLYQTIRNIRIEKADKENELSVIFNKIKSDYPSDWLLASEILELTKNRDLKTEITNYLKNLAGTNPNLVKLITDALQMAEKN
ncbi:MAG: aromatic amino acid hydroxylase [Bacteroidetes bacterium]|nr:aromatic amino acid hydroxylase [Bacteroidota bacterium]